MKKLTVLIALSILILGLSAEPWNIDSDMNLTLSQSAFSDNWQGKEMSNITWMASSNTSMEKQMKEWLHNRNTLKLAFGQTHLQKTNSAGEKYWEAPDKSTDKIDLESLWRFTLQTWVDPFVAGRMESQFLDLSQQDQDNTRFVNPLLFTESAGMMRTFIDNESTSLNTRLGAAFRQNVNRDQMDINLDKETLTTMDGGLQLVSELRKNIEAPLQSAFRSRLQIYQALYNSESDDLATDDWKSPDLVWENSLSTKLFGLVSANLIFELRYDKEQVHELQWKQSLGLGLSYTLF
ncbi:MAG: DUF3078 domain-containing protein [Candidatus Cloacimonadaceae bacterium]|jgi:hypothetical protein|nr:DUF3078 domain-containing protein [Candidatus Cloacimonadota bacterium]MDY0126766.1 DUF3078 domain-containing protein [Candidatus Cloacimonadaceae bacterium]MCB5255357.1 DUF3078 domain-containing protein [Candidatus Cloacimonadota bacterium]MCK9178140.1 DUF3078 domain-containing protein [Candidatus Cloacimonadota bacterium]MCK9242098.1 DUF3078 domain-containing protein [Candidatus Cloacimonadota bacterium]